MAEVAIYACFELIASFSDYDSIVTLSSVCRSARSRLRDLVRVGDPTTRRPLDVVTRLTPFFREIRLIFVRRAPVTVNETLTSLTMTNSSFCDRLAYCVPRLRNLVLNSVYYTSDVCRFWEVRTLRLDRTRISVDLGVLFPRLERLVVANALYRDTVIHTERLESLIVYRSPISGRVNRIGTLVCLSEETIELTAREIGLCVTYCRKLPQSSMTPNLIDCLVTLNPNLSDPGGEWNTLVTSVHRLDIPIDTRPPEHRSKPRLVVMRIDRPTRRKVHVVLHCENSVLLLDTGPKTVIGDMDLRGVRKVVFLGVNAPPSVPEGIYLTTNEYDTHIRRYRELQARIARYENLVNV